MRPVAYALIAIGVLVLAAGLVTAWNYGLYDEPNPATKVAVSASAPAASTNDVRIDGWIDDRRLTHARRVQERPRKGPENTRNS